MYSNDQDSPVWFSSGHPPTWKVADPGVDLVPALQIGPHPHPPIHTSLSQRTSGSGCGWTGQRRCCDWTRMANQQTLPSWKPEEHTSSKYKNLPNSFICVAFNSVSFFLKNGFLLTRLFQEISSHFHFCKSHLLDLIPKHISHKVIITTIALRVKSHRNPWSKCIYNTQPFLQAYHC